MEQTSSTIEPESTKNQIRAQVVASLTCLTIVICAGIHRGWPISMFFLEGFATSPIGYLPWACYMGHIVGIIASSILMDMIGRKTTLLMTAPIFTLSMISTGSFPLTTASQSCAKFMGGVAEGGVLTVTPVYICEICEPKIRGGLASLYEAFSSIGMLIVFFISPDFPTRTSSFILLSFPVVFFVVFIFMPETPHYFLMKDKTELAVSSLKKLRHTDHIDEELSTLRDDVYNQMSEKGRLRDLFFVSSNRRGIIVMCVILFLRIFAGWMALSFIFSSVEGFKTTYWIIMTCAVVIFATLIASVAIDRIGRRILFLISTSGCCLMSIYFSISFFSNNINNWTWILLLGLFTFLFSFTLGLTSVGNCLIGELFSMRVKAKAICLVNIFGSVCFLGSIHFHLCLHMAYGGGAPLIFFANFHFLAFCLCWRFIPETEGKILEEIQNYLKMR